MSSLRRGHANLLCIVPIFADDSRRSSESNLKHISFLFILSITNIIFYFQVIVTYSYRNFATNKYQWKINPCIVNVKKIAFSFLKTYTEKIYSVYILYNCVCVCAWFILVYILWNLKTNYCRNTLYVRLSQLNVARLTIAHIKNKSIIKTKNFVLLYRNSECCFQMLF